jgi:hypothetical protein
MNTTQHAQNLSDMSLTSATYSEHARHAFHPFMLIRPSTRLSVCLPDCLFARLLAQSSVCLSVYLFACPFARLSTYFLVSLSADFQPFCPVISPPARLTDRPTVSPVLCYSFTNLPICRIMSVGEVRRYGGGSEEGSRSAGCRRGSGSVEGKGSTEGSRSTGGNWIVFQESVWSHRKKDR